MILYFQAPGGSETFALPPTSSSAPAGVAMSSNEGGVFSAITEVIPEDLLPVIIVGFLMLLGILYWYRAHRKISRQELQAALRDAVELNMHSSNLAQDPAAGMEPM